MRNSLFRLLRSERGNSVIELGLALPLLITLAMGGVDAVAGFGSKIELQQYAQSGADYVVAAGQEVPSTAEVKSEVVATSGLDASAVTVTSFTECNQIPLQAKGVCANASALRADYMTITVTDTYEPILKIDGMVDFIGTTTLKGSVTIRIPTS